MTSFRIIVIQFFIQLSHGERKSYNVEYAFGQNPRIAAAESPTVTKSSSRLTTTGYRRTRASDLQFHTLTSMDLMAWETAGEVAEVVIAIGPVVQQTKVSLYLGTNSVLFLRTGVESP